MSKVACVYTSGSPKLLNCVRHHSQIFVAAWLAQFLMLLMLLMLFMLFTTDALSRIFFFSVPRPCQSHTCMLLPTFLCNMWRVPQNVTVMWCDVMCETETTIHASETLIFWRNYYMHVHNWFVWRICFALGQCNWAKTLLCWFAYQWNSAFALFYSFHTHTHTHSAQVVWIKTALRDYTNATNAINAINATNAINDIDDIDGNNYAGSQRSQMLLHHYRVVIFWCANMIEKCVSLFFFLPANCGVFFLLSNHIVCTRIVIVCMRKSPQNVDDFCFIMPKADC